MTLAFDPVIVHDIITVTVVLYLCINKAIGSTLYRFNKIYPVINFPEGASMFGNEIQ